MALAIASLATGCASAPRGELREAQSAYRAAEELGAARVPTAAYHLKLAEDQIAQARKLMDEGGDERRQARRLLQRAELDAELAMSYARNNDAQARARRAWDQVQELKQSQSPAQPVEELK